MTDSLSEAAIKLGNEHGTTRAGWLNANHFTKYAAQKIIDGYESSDEQVMGLCPSPLSGEFEGDPNVAGVIDEIAELAGSKELLANANIDDAMEHSSSILDKYEEAYSTAFWGLIIDRCRKLVEDGSES